MRTGKLAITLAALALAWFPSPAQDARLIPITARRFEYSPREVRLKKGETVTLVLKSEDVTHGFLCRPLKIDSDIPPGRETRVTVTPQQAGEFTAICNHFCGAGHGNMKMKLIVE
jgi:cytochrome c oxidase subunit 2